MRSHAALPLRLQQAQPAHTRLVYSCHICLIYYYFFFHFGSLWLEYYSLYWHAIVVQICIKIVVEVRLARIMQVHIRKSLLWCSFYLNIQFVFVTTVSVYSYCFLYQRRFIYFTYNLRLCFALLMALPYLASFNWKAKHSYNLITVYNRRSPCSS